MTAQTPISQSTVSAISHCMYEEAAAIAAAADLLDPQQVEYALALLDKCANRRGKLVVTGVGKSGIVARKIAATFSSVGLMSLYLNPLDALHGDLGLVAADDVILLLSNSGETEELLSILPHLIRRGTARIALVGRRTSSLAQACEVVLEASVQREVCPLNLAPTASTAVAMAIGDALAVAWMERQCISPEDFALNHPAGSLGKQLTLTVADLMIPAEKLHPIALNAPFSEVITQLTRDGIGTCWVYPENNTRGLAGIITDGDLRRALKLHQPTEWSQITASQIMTPDPITIEPTTKALTAMSIMENNQRKSISVLPVVLSENYATSVTVAGIVRLHDLVRAGLR